MTCPFVSKTVESTFGLVGTARYGFWATRGKYEDTVMFFSDGEGMKLVAIHNGSKPSADWGSNWYFHKGECTLHE